MHSTLPPKKDGYTLLRVLLTGGSGYIGSHTAKLISAFGHDPVVFDNLSTGHRWAAKWGPLVTGDLMDRTAIRRTLVEHEIEAVIHFAASAYVAESMRDPGKYFDNNITGTLNLLQAMVDVNVKQIVFSSTCAVYGLPNVLPITEAHPQNPVSPYGESKLVGERALHWYAEIYGLKIAILRYFNAAGADSECQIGEDHIPEYHLIPLVISAALRQIDTLTIYGTDYPTADGTAVRDYVHVTDLAQAHLMALEYLCTKGQNLTLNLGSGTGVSVKEVVQIVHRLTGCWVPVQNMPRRSGDPPILVADNALAARLLGWRPVNSQLSNIIESAWKWHNSSLGKLHECSQATSASR